MRHDPVVHSPHIIGVVGIAEQAPFGERQRLAVRGREFGLCAQPVRLFHEFGERLAGGLVVAVGADDVDRVVPRIALRPRDRVPPPRRREIEPETLARHRAHGRDDPPPVRLPRGGVGRAPAAVGLPVHLPAEHDDRVAGAHRDQPPGQHPVVAVERAGRAAAQQRAQHRHREPPLVRRHHRHVHHQPPPRIGGLPARPRREQPPRALDPAPVVARQVGAPDRHRRAEPPLEPADPLHPLRPGAEERPERHVRRRLLHRLRTHPRHRGGGRQQRQEGGNRQNRRERTEGKRPFSARFEWLPGGMDIGSSHAYHMPMEVRRGKAARTKRAKNLR